MTSIPKSTIRQSQDIGKGNQTLLQDNEVSNIANQTQASTFNKSQPAFNKKNSKTEKSSGMINQHRNLKDRASRNVAIDSNHTINEPKSETDEESPALMQPIQVEVTASPTAVRQKGRLQINR